MSKIHPINMPQWGLEMTEGSIAAWHIAVGDRIVKGRELVDIETSKIVNSMEAMSDMPGVVRRLVGKVGDIVPVGGLLGVTAEPDVSEAEIDSFLAAAGQPVAASAAPTAQPAAVAQPAPVAQPAAVAQPVPAQAAAGSVSVAATAAAASRIYPINMPQWGLEMTEGSIAAWHVAVGDRITKGRELVDIETSKIVNSMEAMNDMPGVVRRLVGKVGDIVPVGGLLGVTAEPDVSEAEIDLFLGGAAQPVAAAAVPATPVATPAPPAAQPAAAQAAAIRPAVVASVAVDAPVPPAQAPARAPLSAVELDRIVAANATVNASPVARRQANRAGIELSRLAGTGRHGRVSVEDVVALAPELQTSVAELPTLNAQQLAQRNGGAHASPVALRLANRSGVDLAALAGSGRHGRISVADVEAVLERLQPAVNVVSSVTAAAPGDVRAGPAARKLAAEQGVNLASVQGSGPRNLVLKADVQESIRNAAQSPAPQATAVQAPVDDHQLIPLTAMRKAIAASLTHSKQTIPHFYLTIDLQLDPLIALRQSINAQSEGRRKLSINDFLMRAVALALHDVPAANVHFTDAGIKQFSGVHLCLAVAIDGGLVTPVIRNAESKSVFAIAAEVVELAERARNRSLTQAHMSGGTFTVSNLGMFGVRQFDAVINPPQGGILAVGNVRREACEAADGSVEFRSLMSVTMSCDHRAIDGAVGATFLAALRKWVDRPYALLG